MHTRRSTRLYPKFCAESPSTPPPPRPPGPQFTPPAPALDRQRHGQSRPDPAGQRSQRGGPGRLGLGRAGVLYGARVSCPSAGREVRRAVLRCHSPPRALRRRLAVGVRSRVGPPQSPHRAPGCRGCAQIPARPLPRPPRLPPPSRPARSGCPGARTCSRRAGLGCTASAAGGLREGRDRAGRERRILERRRSSSARGGRGRRES